MLVIFFPFLLGVVLSCTVRFGHVMKTARYAVRYMVTFGAHSYPSRLRNTVTTSAVNGARYDRALGGSQTCIIWLPNFYNETSVIF